MSYLSLMMMMMGVLKGRVGNGYYVWSRFVGGRFI